MTEEHQAALPPPSPSATQFDSAGTDDAYAVLGYESAQPTLAQRPAPAHPDMRSD